MSLVGLEALLGDLRIDLYGYAAVCGLFENEWANWPYAISIAMALAKDSLAAVAEGPTSVYYTAYQDINIALNRAAQALESWLREQGYAAQAFAATVTAEELDSDLGEDLIAPVQHKTVATRAGLGWIGKSGLLITRRYGPRVRLASVFTTMPLPIAVPIESSECGSCTCCVRSCPAGAIKGVSWEVGTPREALVDIQACRRTAERLLWAKTGHRDSVCGICIAVCPFAGLRTDERTR